MNKPDSLRPSSAPSPGESQASPGLLGGFFLLALAAVLPPLLILVFLVLPGLKGLQANQEEILARLDRIEKVAALTYFSRKPGASSLAEILKYLRYWTEEETRCLPQEVRSCKEREKTAVQALHALGKPALQALIRETLAQDTHAGAKYYRKALLEALARIDPDQAAGVAGKILLDPKYSTQTRIFAARELLKLSRDRGVQALRECVKENDHRSMEGYSALLQTYLEETTDQARGEVIYKILHRPTLDSSTVQVILQDIPLLDPKDPYLKKLCQDMANLFFRRNLETFRAAVLLRPIAFNLRRQIIRSMSRVLPAKALKPFLEEALKITVQEGTRREILKYLREKCR